MLRTVGTSLCSHRPRVRPSASPPAGGLFLAGALLRFAPPNTLRAMAKIGMSTGVAATDLGLGGTLAEQVKNETEEERKKRLLGMSSLQSSAASMMLGLGGRGG